MSVIQFGLKEAAEHSNTLVEWTLLLYAGSVATIVSTSYIRPPTKKLRLIYLSFPPAWILLAISIFYGRQINGRYLASIFSKPEFHSSIRAEMMSDLEYQINFLQCGMIFLGIWLILYVLWWVFGEWNDSKKE
ncbi:MAG TPA: hypothetical protein VMW09_00440 [Desulfatiglandales bacterium]|nr:hypothetical protein [Desulfatiglandales bacterium]